MSRSAKLTKRQRRVAKPSLDQQRWEAIRADEAIRRAISALLQERARGVDQRAARNPAWTTTSDVFAHIEGLAIPTLMAYKSRHDRQGAVIQVLKDMARSGAIDSGRKVLERPITGGSESNVWKAISSADEDALLDAAAHDPEAIAAFEREAGLEDDDTAPAFCFICGAPLKMGYPGGEPDNGPARLQCPTGRHYTVEDFATLHYSQVVLVDALYSFCEDTIPEEEPTPVEVKAAARLLLTTIGEASADMPPLAVEVDSPAYQTVVAENRRLRETLEQVLAHMPSRATRMRAVIQNALGKADPKRKSR